MRAIPFTYIRIPYHKRERGVVSLRDLKHLIYFENLLDNADNELVEQAKAEGKLAIGYT